MTITALSPSVEKLITESLAIEAEEAQEAGALGFMARAMVQATLPHKRVIGNEFTRKNGAFTLNMLAPSHIGLPYGSMPRLLLAWLTTEAVRTQSRELELGHNLSGFMRELGILPTGGRWGSITSLKNQTRRLFATTVSCMYTDDDKTAMAGYRLADKAMLWWDQKDPEQAALWQSTVTLTETFFKEVTEHPVPIDMRALKALRRSPMALDIYTWSTWRMSYLRRPTMIPWQGLVTQFGSEYGRLRDFRSAFLGELRKVQAVYPALNVDSESKGLVIRPSQTHISRSQR